MSWNFAALAGCLVLLLFLLWQETRRANRARLRLRLAAVALAVGSLACLALPVTLTTKLDTDPLRTVVLLTEGYQFDSVHRFLQRFEQPPPVFILDAPAGAGPQLYAAPLPSDSLRPILARYPERHVFGYGFDQDKLQDTIGLFHFHPSPLPAGIQSINWLQQTKAGEPLVVQGSCNNPFLYPLQIVLSGLGATLDSAIIAPTSTGLFFLSGVPKLRGKALFSLTVMHHTDTLEGEPMPVQADTTGPIHVLLLAAAPNFENRFLKDWLAKMEYAVTVHTTISTGKQNRLFANTANQAADRINPSLLSKTDILISDPAALASLGQQEQQAVRRQVAESGLGLIVRADSLLPRSFFSGSFPLVQTGDSLLKQLPVYTLSALPDTGLWQAGQPLYIRAQPGSQPLVQTGASGVLASCALVGSGKVVLTTLPNSYSWLLAGNDKMYGAYWSLLMNKALRKQTGNKITGFSPSLPTANEPVSVHVEGDETGPPDDPVSGIRMAYAQHASLPFIWQTTYWPKTGWQTTGGKTGSVNWYVYDAQNWKGIKARKKLQATKNYLLQQSEQRTMGTTKAALQRVPVPKIYFFIIFIFGAGFLWIEKKFG